MIVLRTLIFDITLKLEPQKELKETLKWGEPSYLLKGGTPVRIDWKEFRPDHVGIYFHCNTKLIATFQTLYDKKLAFEGNRAILLDITTKLPHEIIEHCIEVALTYHKRKKLPLLGL